MNRAFIQPHKMPCAIIKRSSIFCSFKKNEVIWIDLCKGLGGQSSKNVNCHCHRQLFCAFEAGFKKMISWLVWKIGTEDLNLLV